MHFQIGDRVKVVFPSGDLTGINTVKQFENVTTVVKSIHICRKGKSSLGYEYTLMGCKTDYGLDYHFCEQWLIPIGEEAE